jgi:hypothetical protein
MTVEVRYQLERTDQHVALLQFKQEKKLHSPDRVPLYYFPIATILLLVGGTLLILAGQLLSNPVVFIVVLLIWGSWWFRFQPKLTLIESQLARHLTHKPLRMILSAEGLSVDTLDTRELARWSAIRRIALLRDYVFFLTKENRYQLMGHLLPRRAFATRQACDEFVELAQRYQKEACEGAPDRAPRLPSPGHESQAIQPKQDGIQ